MNEIVNYINEAIMSDTFIELLEGKNHYRMINNSHLANLSTPNDYVRILKEGIYSFEEHEISEIKILLEDSLVEMSKADILGLYCAVEILYTQLLFEMKEESPFKIDKEKILPVIRKEIEEKKEYLQKYYDWEGRNEIEGMYGYMKRMNIVFSKRFLCSII